MRIAMGVEYDGSAFHGWQRQRAGPTVQACVEKAVARVADQPVRMHCAGRTDAGVHALGQVIHFDTEARRSPRSWVLGSNVNLPPEVNILWAQEMPEEFHARYRATGRHYRYQILNRMTRSGLYRHQLTWHHWPLDAGRMHEAAQALVGTHDFSSYRALGCQARSPVRSVGYLRVHRQGERILIEIGANGFLHHMVRNIAGVLMAIGRGEQPVHWACTVLEARDRTQGGMTAPPQGLYLVGVDYPPAFDLPTWAAGDS